MTIVTPALSRVGTQMKGTVMSMSRSKRHVDFGVHNPSGPDIAPQAEAAAAEETKRAWDSEESVIVTRLAGDTDWLRYDNGEKIPGVRVFGE